MARATQTGQQTTAGAVGGVWKKDSVKDVAESVGIANLPDEVAIALAGDVEYRLWEIIEESIKFMRHSRRTRLKVEDVDNALKARNMEPLWGFASTSHLPFKKTVTPTGIVYSVEDDEIDLNKVIKGDMPSVPRDISFTAHWLAIEGVQPLIKENPSPAELAKLAPRTVNAAGAGVAAASGVPGTQTGGANSIVTPLVKHVLSRELQLYFTRLTEALGRAGGGASENKAAALGSVRSDPGLHQLVPYLVSWGGEQIASHLDDLGALERALDLFHAMLDNPTLFIEPYLHQLTPPVLTCLLTSALPPAPPGSNPTPLTIRTSAASLLHLLLDRHSSAYPSLRPRITKTLLRGLVGKDNRSLGGRWGAARGLSGIVGEEGGNKAVREWIGGGLKTLGELMEREEEIEEGERSEVVRQVLAVLTSSLLPSDTSDASPASPDIHELHDRYGPLFGDAIGANWEKKLPGEGDFVRVSGRDIYEAVPGSQQGEEEAGSPMKMV
ncbi:transcription initiation factor TFIID subunit 6, partial [Phenoliferia sp. Uapishka_3]